MQAMRGAIYLGESRFGQDTPHGDGFIEIFGTIVNTWQQMTMPVDHSFPSLGISRRGWAPPVVVS
jgi:hypothetical protein